MSSDLSDIPLPSIEFCAAAPGDKFQETCRDVCMELLNSSDTSYVAEHTHSDFGVSKNTTYTNENAARVCVLDIKQNMIDAKEKETPPSE